MLLGVSTYLLPKGKLIFIHGVSGVGKSTIGQEIAMRLHNSVWIDQDQFYRKDKPLVTFSNGPSPFLGQGGILPEYASSPSNKTYVSYTAQNWDSEEAIDFDMFRKKIEELQYLYRYVIVTGFALRTHCIKLKPHYSFLLTFGVDDRRSIDLISKARAQSKSIGSHKQEKDYWMVWHVVWPFYQETIKLIGLYINVYVYKNDQRINPSFIADTIVKYITNPGVII